MFKMLFLLGLLCTAALSFIRPISTANCSVQECILKSKIENFGFDIDITEGALEVDIGECSTVYHPNISSRCFEDEMCIPECSPRSYNIELHNNRDGPVEVPVIKSCSPTRHHCSRKCRKVPKIQYYFQNSKYQSRVNVGSCTGGCDDEEDSCMATKTVSRSINGPNGAITVDVIEECQCTYEKCYRMDYWESYWNYTTCGNSTVKVEKLINVGRCQGDCEDIFTPGRCYPSDANCLLYFPGTATKCVPTKNSRDTYVDANLETQSVQIVTECGCRSA